MKTKMAPRRILSPVSPSHWCRGVSMSPLRLPLLMYGTDLIFSIAALCIFYFLLPPLMKPQIFKQPQADGTPRELPRELRFPHALTCAAVIFISSCISKTIIFTACWRVPSKFDISRDNSSSYTSTGLHVGAQISSLEHVRVSSHSRLMPSISIDCRSSVSDAMCGFPMPCVDVCGYVFRASTPLRLSGMWALGLAVVSVLLGAPLTSLSDAFGLGLCFACLGIFNPAAGAILEAYRAAVAYRGVLLSFDSHLDEGPWACLDRGTPASDTDGSKMMVKCDEHAIFADQHTAFCSRVQNPAHNRNLKLLSTAGDLLCAPLLVSIYVMMRIYKALCSKSRFGPIGIEVHSGGEKDTPNTSSVDITGHRIAWPLCTTAEKPGITSVTPNQGQCDSRILVDGDQLGQLLLFCAVLPLVSCGVAAFGSCYVLPMDWPTVYVEFPAPMLIAVFVSNPIATLVSFLVLLLLPQVVEIDHFHAQASPLLQELFLEHRKSNGSSEIVA